jgi:heme-degrading monooxygenase HmoA
MINRVWHGWTTRANANSYEKFLHAEMLPGMHRVKGFKGATLLRRDAGDEIEFVTITLFDSIEAVKGFAGEDYEVAVVLREARKLLTHFDARSLHYDTVFEIE